VSRRVRLAGTLVLAASLLGAACGDEGPSGSATDGTTTESSTTRSTPSSATPPPHSRPGDDAVVLTDDDAVLVAPTGARAVTVDPDDPCAELAGAGTCDVAGDLVWVVSPGGSAGGSPVTVSRLDGDAATPVLTVARAERAEYGAATVVAAELDGRPGEELVVGLRNVGTGGLLQLDVVGADGTVVAHVTLDRGRAEVDGGVLRTWAARFLPDDPNCCPSRFEAAVVGADGGRWYVTPVGEVASDDVPPGDFPEVG
jgi:hypothetical protein